MELDLCLGVPVDWMAKRHFRMVFIGDLVGLQKEVL